MPIVTLDAAFVRGAVCPEDKGKIDYYNHAITGFILPPNLCPDVPGVPQLGLHHQPPTASPSHAAYPPRPNRRAGITTLLRNAARVTQAPPRANLHPSATGLNPSATLSRSFERSSYV